MRLWPLSLRRARLFLEAGGILFLICSICGVVCAFSRRTKWILLWSWFWQCVWAEVAFVRKVAFVGGDDDQFLCSCGVRRLSSYRFTVYRFTVACFQRAGTRE